MMGLYDLLIKYGNPIVDKKAMSKHHLLACFSFKSAYYKLKGLPHAYCVGVPTVNHVRQKWSNKQCGGMSCFFTAYMAPKIVKIKRDSTWC